MKAAVAQIRARPGDVAANLATIDQATGAAAAAGAELIVFPELATTGYGAGPAIRELAEPPDGPQLQRLAAIADAHGLALVAGFPERDGDQVYNALAFLRAGAAPLVYRKTHLYADYERALFIPGEIRPTVVDFAGLRLGFLICYDVEFPENVRRLAQAGAEVIVVPTALPAGPHAQFIAASLVPVRAFENQVFVLYANHAGADERFRYAGHSCIAAPDGACLAAAPDDAPALLLADLEPAAYEDSRRANTYLEDLRRG